MMIRFLVVALALSAAACGAGSSATCNLPDQKVCVTIAISGATAGNPTCSGSIVASCAAATAGRCVVTQSGTVSGVSVSTTTTYNYYTGTTESLASKTGCEAVSGTWTP